MGAILSTGMSHFLNHLRDLMHNSTSYYVSCVPGSSVGIATGYGLDGPRIESRCDRDFPHLFRTAVGPTQPPVQWVPGLSRGWKAAGT
jgi:hypothetical protein